MREVPGSTPGQAPRLLFCRQNILQAVYNSIDFYGFLYYWLLGYKELNDRSKEEKQKQAAKTGSEKDTILSCENLDMH